MKPFIANSRLPRGQLKDHLDKRCYCGKGLFYNKARHNLFLRVML